ncbi:MAG: hypothetical protein QOG87_4323 [Actinomycetota bacterium]
MTIVDESRAASTAELLWSACAPAPNGPAVAAAVAAGADLDLAAREALIQRLSGMVTRGLQAGGVDTSGAWAQEMLRDAARCRAHADLVLRQLGVKALEPLASAGVEAVVFKGASLAERYPALGLRTMDDVDLILPSEFHPAAIDALTKAGWRVVRPAGRVYYDVALVHPQLPGLPVELHRALSTWHIWANGPSATDLWERRVPQTVFGTAAFGLPPELELVALAGHASKPFHLFDRLIWSVDVAVVIDAASRAAPIDWDDVDREARRVGCRTAVAVLLSHARHLGASVPDEMCVPAATRTRRKAVAPLFAPDWPVVPNNTYRRRLEFSVVDGWQRRLAMTLAWSATPSFVGAPGRLLSLARAGMQRWWRLRSMPTPRP